MLAALVASHECATPCEDAADAEFLIGVLRPGIYPAAAALARAVALHEEMSGGKTAEDAINDALSELTWRFDALRRARRIYVRHYAHSNGWPDAT